MSPTTPTKAKNAGRRKKVTKTQTMEAAVMPKVQMQTAVATPVASALLMFTLIVSSSLMIGLFAFGALRAIVKTPVSLQVQTVCTTNEYQQLSASRDKKVLKVVFKAQGGSMEVQQMAFAVNGLKIQDILSAELLEAGSGRSIAKTEGGKDESLVFQKLNYVLQPNNTQRLILNLDLAPTDLRADVNLNLNNLAVMGKSTGRLVAPQGEIKACSFSVEPINDLVKKALTGELKAEEPGSSAGAGADVESVDAAELQLGIDKAKLIHTIELVATTMQGKIDYLTAKTGRSQQVINELQNKKNTYQAKQGEVDGASGESAFKQLVKNFNTLQTDFENQFSSEKERLGLNGFVEGLVLLAKIKDQLNANQNQLNALYAAYWQVKNANLALLYGIYGDNLAAKIAYQQNEVCSWGETAFLTAKLTEYQVKKDEFINNVLQGEENTPLKEASVLKFQIDLAGILASYPQALLSNVNIGSPDINAMIRRAHCVLQELTFSLDSVHQKLEASLEQAAAVGKNVGNLPTLNREAIVLLKTFTGPASDAYCKSPNQARSCQSNNDCPGADQAKCFEPLYAKYLYAPQPGLEYSVNYLLKYVPAAVLNLGDYKAKFIAIIAEVQNLLPDLSSLLINKQAMVNQIQGLYNELSQNLPAAEE